MTHDFEVTFRYDKVREDSAKFQSILKEMNNYKISTSDEDEAIRQWKDELRRRLRAAGLSK